MALTLTYETDASESVTASTATGSEIARLDSSTGVTTWSNVVGSGFHEHYAAVFHHPEAGGGSLATPVLIYDAVSATKVLPWSQRGSLRALDATHFLRIYKVDVYNGALAAHIVQVNGDDTMTVGPLFTWGAGAAFPAAVAFPQPPVLVPLPGSNRIVVLGQDASGNLIGWVLTYSGSTISAVSSLQSLLTSGSGYYDMVSATALDDSTLLLTYYSTSSAANAVVLSATAASLTVNTPTTLPDAASFLGRQFDKPALALPGGLYRVSFNITPGAFSFQWRDYAFTVSGTTIGTVTEDPTHAAYASASGYLGANLVASSDGWVVYVQSENPGAGSVATLEAFYLDTSTGLIDTTRGTVGSIGTATATYKDAQSYSSFGKGRMVLYVGVDTGAGTQRATEVLLEGLPRPPAQCITDAYDRVDTITTTTHAADAYNRTNGAIGTADVGGAYAVLAGNWQVLSNQAACTDGTSRQDNVAVIDCGTADLTLQADVPVKAPMAEGGAGAGIAFRSSDVSNRLQAIAFTSGVSGAVALYLQKIVAGVPTTIGGPLTLSPATITVVCRGSLIQCYADGARVMSVTETFNQTVTKHGLTSYWSTAARLDNLTATTLGSTGLGIADTGETWVQRKYAPYDGTGAAIAQDVSQLGIVGNQVSTADDFPNQAPDGIGHADLATIDHGYSSVDESIDVVAPFDSGGGGGLIFRWSGDAAFWQAFIFRVGGGGYSAYLRKVTDATHFTDVVVQPVYASGHTGAMTLRVVASGSRIMLLVDGTEVDTVTDSFNATATEHGIETYFSLGVRLDNYSGCPVGPPAPLALRRRPDDNVTGNPVLPRFHGTPQRSSALGAGTSW